MRPPLPDSADGSLDRAPQGSGAPVESTLTLIMRARSGDSAARESLARRYLVALRRFAHGRLPSAARGVLDTDDLVQVAVTRTLSRIETFEPNRQ